MIPRYLFDELLDSLPILIVQIGDPLARFGFRSGHQASRVLHSMLSLLGSREAQQKGSRKTVSRGNSPRTSSGETSAWFIISPNRDSNRRSMTHSLCVDLRDGRR